MRRIFFIISIFLISACTRQAVYIYPDGNSLKDAQVGVPYNELISIPGVINMGFSAKITPSNSGLTWSPSDYAKPVLPATAKDYSRIQIQGTPIHPGEIQIKISGGIYGNMFTKVGKFNKTYTIKVKE
ncbi:hypothetical protein FE394_01665 [Xenorhabdus sp. Reich]|uniref:Lipoprotein n=1 Tax=Xenorhabdus littoralis TaxID=2582835 RepID=A0ABU4SH10_9GAMM|nr:hypothetical protein [Xenorhabdus sp. Reich]MDX7997937.1 hypothetical protein [Xenorhabdus sp. Reich]